jgi:hypothetical protein
MPSLVMVWTTLAGLDRLLAAKVDDGVEGAGAALR